MSERPLVLQSVPLGFQWPTADPYLFCVHHLDHYPAGNAQLGPQGSLAGRTIGNDFEPRDGWRMYHGSTVPGFPEHPHRGFETITFARQGLIDHSDSMGARARFGRGDVQWMTAGRGVVHSEMFPLLDREGPNTAELFQIWMNLPAADKMVDPHFTMLWADDIPRHLSVDEHGRRRTVTVIAGKYDDGAVRLVPSSPPPASWASRPEAAVAIWHIVLDPGASLELPAADDSGVGRVLYVFDGGVRIGERHALLDTGVVVDGAQRVPLVADESGVEILLLQGRPIAEPVARYGPFVMNTDDEIRQAFSDYRNSGFGGWPWDRSDPVHGTDPGRFAVHADGRLDQPR